MRAVRLNKQGNSLMLTIPAQIRRQLGWWQSDVIVQEIVDDTLVLRNHTQQRVRPIVRKAEYGDAQTKRF